MIIPLGSFALKINKTRHGTIEIKLNDGVEIVAVTEISLNDFYEAANEDNASRRIEPNDRPR